MNDTNKLGRMYKLSGDKRTLQEPTKEKSEELIQFMETEESIVLIDALFEGASETEH